MEKNKQVSSHTPGEIRNEYVDDDNYTHIDVWLTDNDDEAGKTVAIVCNDTHKVFFIDNMYRTNEKVNASIEEVLISAPSTLTLKAENEKLKADKAELFQMVKDLKNCIKRLTQDNLPQFERDTEAQWEGEAHELLTRINPNYYRNANE